MRLAAASQSLFFPRRTFLSDSNELRRIQRALESGHTTGAKELITAKYVSKLSLSSKTESFNYEARQREKITDDC